MTKPSREERLELGGQAKAFLDSPLFNRVMDSVKDHFVGVLMNTAPGSEAAVKAHAALFAVPSVINELRAISNDGEMARKERS